MNSKLLSPQWQEDRLKRAALIAWTGVGIAVLVAMAGWIFSYIGGLLYPFIYAGIVVYLLRPIVERFVGLGLPRLLAVLLTYVIFFSVGALLLIYLVPIIIAQFSSLIDNFPAYAKVLSRYFELVRRRYIALRLPSEEAQILEGLASNVRDRAVIGFRNLPELGLGIFGGMVNIVLAPVIAFYVLKDLPAIKATLLELFPLRQRANVRVVFHQIDFVLGGFLRGQALVSLVVAVTTGFSLWLAGVNFPLLLGILTGILNIIPYFGPILGGTAAATVALFQSPSKALLVVIIMFTVQQLDGMIISPNIMRHAVDLHPTVIIFSLILGGAVFGFLGLILAIPVAAIAKALFMYFFYPQEELPPELVEPEAAS